MLAVQVFDANKDETLFIVPMSKLLSADQRAIDDIPHMWPRQRAKIGIRSPPILSAIATDPLNQR